MLRILSVNVWGECSAYLLNRYINCVFVWTYQKMRQWEMWVGGSMPQFPLLAAGWPEVYSRYFTDGPCGIKERHVAILSSTKIDLLQLELVSRIKVLLWIPKDSAIEDLTWKDCKALIRSDFKKEGRKSVEDRKALTCFFRIKSTFLWRAAGSMCP